MCNQNPIFNFFTLCIGTHTFLFLYLIQALPRFHCLWTADCLVFKDDLRDALFRAGKDRVGKLFLYLIRHGFQLQPAVRFWGGLDLSLQIELIKYLLEQQQNLQNTRQKLRLLTKILQIDVGQALLSLKSSTSKILSARCTSSNFTSPHKLGLVNFPFQNVSQITIGL